MKEKIVSKYKKMLGFTEPETKALASFIFEDAELKRLSLLKVGYARVGRSKWFKKVGAKRAAISDMIPPLIAEDCKKEGYTFIFVQ